MGLLSTVLGVALYALLAFRIWQAAGAAGLSHRWLAWVPIAGFALVFRLAGASPWWAASIVVPPVFFAALLWFWHAPARRADALGWWWLTLVAVVLIPASFLVEFVGGATTAGTLGLNVARLLLVFGLWELLRPGVTRAAPSPLPARGARAGGRLVA